MALEVVKQTQAMSLRFLLFCVAVSLPFSVHAVDIRRLVKERDTREFPCPIDADIVPCTCTHDEVTFDLFLDCSTVESNEQLAHVFTADFPFTVVHTLTIDQADCATCDLTIIDQNTFGIIAFQHVSIINTNIEIVADGAFAYSHNELVSLTLNNNLIYQFPFDSLLSYTELTGLYLKNNAFNDGHKIEGIISPSLANLHLAPNPQANFSADLVQQTPTIRNVDLRDTGLTSIPEFTEIPHGMFTNLPIIETVDLAKNKISVINTESIYSTEDTFLKVDLNDNLIAHVNPRFVAGKV